jgi:hypothetical protein
MAIIVEDGSIVTGANSYATTAELSAFAAARNITLSGDYTTEQLLIIAMDYIENLAYKGMKVRSDQPLQWPRVDVYLDAYYFDSDAIPSQLKNGQMQVALSIDAGNSPQQIAPRKTIMEKVGDLAVQYAAGSSSVAIDPKINAFLYKLLDAGGPGSANTVGNKG